jgi:type IV pilus assembly protein PilA
VVAPAPPPPPPPPARRGPSDALRARWIFGASPQFALYADAAGLLHSPLIGALTPPILALVEASPAEARPKPADIQCIKDVLAAAKEVLVGAVNEDELVMIRFDEGVASPAACLASNGAAPATLAGAPDAYRLDHRRIAHFPGLLIIGPEGPVTTAVQQAAPRPVPDELSLGDDQYVAWQFTVPGIGSGKGGLTASASRFRLDVDATIPEPIAQKLESEIAGAKASVTASVPDVSKADAALLQSLTAAVKASREGGHVSLAFDLEEPVIDQARDIGGAAALAISAVRKYIANAKSAEARNNVGQIAKSYIAYWEGEQMPGTTVKAKTKNTKKLISLPAVPAAVPRGMKYQSAPTEWKAWSVIRFSIDEPQYYQYEVVAAKDGKSAEVLARGDLNGDGKTSLYKVKLTVDPKDHSIHPSNVEVTDPLE